MIRVEIGRVWVFICQLQFQEFVVSVHPQFLQADNIEIIMGRVVQESCKCLDSDFSIL